MHTKRFAIILTINFFIVPIFVLAVDATQSAARDTGAGSAPFAGTADPVTPAPSSVPSQKPPPEFRVQEITEPALPNNAGPNSLGQTPQKPPNTALWAVIVTLTLGALAWAFSKFFAKSNTEKTDDKDDPRCENIKSLLDQKLKDLEDTAKSWPEDKLKDLIIAKTLTEEQKALVAKYEAAKSKYENLKKSADLLRGKYDLCMLKLPSAGQRRFFITGIPTAGKSFLAKRIIKELGGKFISADDLREELENDPKYKSWVNFYLDQDEKTYYTSTNHEQQWQNLVKQSEALWPGILEILDKSDNNEKMVIFEGVNILPHLAKRDLKFPGIVLIGKSFNETFERNKKDPRWGKTEELQKLEAEAFFYGERPHYKEEAEKYGYPVFDDVENAFKEATNLLK